MATVATHIKFALDIKDKYEIQDISKYLSGTVYPDSRYFSKINRELTHGNYLLSPEFAINDFKKGWAVHFLCDKAGNIVIDRELPELFINLDKDTSWGTEHWLVKKAINVVQTIELMKKFGVEIRAHLPMLNYVENPNNEPIEMVKLYNQTNQRFYNKKEIIVDDFKQLWLDFAVSKEVVDKIILKAKELAKDLNLMKKINGLYKEMISLYV